MHTHFSNSTVHEEPPWVGYSKHVRECDMNLISFLAILNSRLLHAEVFSSYANMQQLFKLEEALLARLEAYVETELEIVKFSRTYNVLFLIKCVRYYRFHLA